MSYRFSLDDNIFLFADLSEQTYASLFDQPYLKFLRELHSEYGAKIQLNCYFETEGFCLRDMSGKYREEWEENADWLRLSFHARKDDPPNPYAEADYQELYQDCNMVQEEIRRFAGEKTLDLYTTLHYCQAAPEGVRALRDCGIKGLVGLFGTAEKPQSSYSLPEDVCRKIRETGRYYDPVQQMWFLNNDYVLNNFGRGELQNALEKQKDQEFFEVMIHEQYFYHFTGLYQADFCEKVRDMISWLVKKGHQAVFLDDLLE